MERPLLVVLIGLVGRRRGYQGRELFDWCIAAAADWPPTTTWCLCATHLTGSWSVCCRKRPIAQKKSKREGGWCNKMRAACGRSSRTRSRNGKSESAELSHVFVQGSTRRKGVAPCVCVHNSNTSTHYGWNQLEAKRGTVVCLEKDKIRTVRGLGNFTVAEPSAVLDHGCC